MWNNNDRVDLKVIDFRGNVTSSFFNILARDEDIASRLSQSVLQKFHNTASSRSDFIPSNLIPYDRIAMAAYKRGLIPANWSTSSRSETYSWSTGVLPINTSTTICCRDQYSSKGPRSLSMTRLRRKYPVPLWPQLEQIRSFVMSTGMRWLLMRIQHLGAPFYLGLAKEETIHTQLMLTFWRQAVEEMVLCIKLASICSTFQVREDRRLTSNSSMC